MSIPWYLDRNLLNKYQNQYYHNKVKNSVKYYCHICNTNCYNLTNYTKHMKTKKHSKNQKGYNASILLRQVKQVESPYKEKILDMIYSKYGEPRTDRQYCQSTK